MYDQRIKTEDRLPEKNQTNKYEMKLKKEKEQTSSGEKCVAWSQAETEVTMTSKELASLGITHKLYNTVIYL